MKTLGGARLAFRRRLDFQPPIAGQMTCARIVVANIRRRLDQAAAVNRWLHVDALAEAPIAFDDGIGCIDAVDDDGHTGAAWNHDVRTVAAGRGARNRCDQNRQCKYGTHDQSSSSAPYPLLK